MTNLIVLADLHMWDFKLYNPTPHARLNQIDGLADRMLRVSKEFNSNELFILGDLIDRPLAPPRVIHVLRSFLNKLSKVYNIHIIKGQHDQDSKALVFKETDSFVNIFTDDDKIDYANDKFYQFEDCIVYCHDYMNTENVPLPDTHIDIFMSHMSLGFGQDTDHSKFKLGVFGDIHEPVQYGNCYSVGTPYQLYPHQPEEGLFGVVTIEGNKCKYTRYPVNDSLFKTIKLKETEQYRNSVQFQAVDEEVVSQNIKLSEDIYKQLEDLIKENHLESVHNRIDKNDLPVPINFNFKLETLDIWNFKSIEEMHLDFKSLGKIIYLSGHNGSGKTATIEALITALLGDRQIRKFNRKCSEDEYKPCKLIVKLLYNGNEYTIEREPGATYYKINDEDISRNNKSLLESQIYEDLPFLGYLSYFIVRANSHFFLNVDRTELIKTCFNLGVFDYFNQKGNELLYEYNKQLPTLEGTITGINTSIDNLNQQLEPLKSHLTELKLPNKSESELYNDINSIQNKSYTISTKYNTINEYKSLIDKLTNTEPIEESLADTANNEIKLYTENDSKKLKYDKLIRERDSYKSSLSRFKANSILCSNCGHTIYLSQSSIDDMKLKLDKVTAEINEMNFIPLDNSSFTFKSISEARNLVSKFNAYVSSQSQVTEYINKYNELATEITELVNDYNSTLNGLDESQYIEIRKAEIEVIKDYNRTNNSILQISNSIKSTEDKRVEVEKNIKDCKLHIGEVTKYIALFNISDLNSIAYQLLDKVTKSMNSDIVQFSTTRELASGDLRFSVNANIKVQGVWIDYDSASDGQKCILDLFILNRIISLLGTPGLLIMDESLANIDVDKYETAREFLSNASVKNIVITSHSEMFSGETTRINYVLDNNITKTFLS